MKWSLAPSPWALLGVKKKRTTKNRVLLPRVTNERAKPSQAKHPRSEPAFALRLFLLLVLLLLLLFLLLLLLLGLLLLIKIPSPWPLSKAKPLPQEGEPACQPPRLASSPVHPAELPLLRRLQDPSRLYLKLQTGRIFNAHTLPWTW